MTDQTTALTSRQKRRWPRRLLIVFVTLAALYAAYRYTLHRMVEAKLDEIREQGYPVTLAELDKWYPQPPSGENAADIYAEAFVNLREWAWSQRKVLPIVGQTNLPAASEPIDPAMTQHIENYTAENAAALADFRRAVSVPTAKFPINFEKGYQALLPHLSKLKTGGELLTLDAVLQAERGRQAEAVTSLLACLAIDRALLNEPLIISQLTRRRITSAALEVLQRILSRAPLSDQQLQELTSAIRLEEVPYSAPRALSGERCFVIDMFERIRSGRVDAEELHGLLGGNLCGTPSIPSILFPFYRLAGFLEIDELKALKIMDAYVTASQLPLEHRLPSAASAQGMVDDCLRVWRNHFTAILIGPDYSVLKTDAVREAELRVAIVGLQIEQNRLTSGRIPEVADELSLTATRAVSRDPFTGQPLRYKKLAKGYVVYSVGEDGKDDGGDEKKDITFTVER